MAISRRQFIKRGGLVGAGALLGPQLFGSAIRQAHALLDDSNRYFVVIFLDGGNDGLNTVVPVENGLGTLRDDYEAARNNIRITPDELQGSLIGADFFSQAQLGLHPGFNVPNDFFENGAGAGGLKALWDQGDVAVIQGCGYPDYSLSHEEARVIWQTGIPLGPSVGTGWIGRHLALEYGGNQIPAVNINDSIVGEFRQTGTSILAIRNLENFSFPLDYAYGDDDQAKRDAFSALNASAVSGGQPAAVFLGNTGTATIDSTTAYQSLTGLYDATRAAYGQAYEDIGRSLANDLREVARVIYGVEQGVPDVNARFFQLSNGGYDTHSDQGAANQNGQHFALHAELGAALKVFFDDLATMNNTPGNNVADRVTVLVWSEFSRRVPENTNGTDHGSQGPMFVIGGGVVGGVYGNHPNINGLALDGERNTEYTQSGNNFRSTDFRDVYGTILKNWVGLSDGTVQDLLPLDATPEAIGDPDHYWRFKDFDLGFL